MLPPKMYMVSCTRLALCPHMPGGIWPTQCCGCHMPSPLTSKRCTSSNRVMGPAWPPNMYTPSSQRHADWPEVAGDRKDIVAAEQGEGSTGAKEEEAWPAGGLIPALNMSKK